MFTFNLIKPSYLKQADISAEVDHCPLVCQSRVSSCGLTKDKWAEGSGDTSTICVGQLASTAIQRAKAESSSLPIKEHFHDKVAFVAFVALPSICVCLCETLQVLQRYDVKRQIFNEGDTGCEVNGSAGILRVARKP